MTTREQGTMQIKSKDKVIIDLHDKCPNKDITVTYSNLNNSYYLEKFDEGDKTKTNRIKISRIDRTFSGIQAGDIIFTSDGQTAKPHDCVYDKCDGPQLIIYKDPSDGFFYNNIKQVSVKDIYYDDKGNPITFKDGDKNKAWIFVTSLNSDGVGNNNHRGDGKEYVEKVKAENPDGTPAEMKKIAGSTVTGPVDENTTKDFTRTVELFDGSSNGDYLRKYLSYHVDDLKKQGWIWQENSSELTQTVTLHVKKTNDGYVYDNADAFFKGLKLPSLSENGTEKYPDIEIPEVRVGSKTAVRIRVSYSANPSTPKPLDETEVDVDEEKVPDTHDGWWYSDESNSPQNNYPDWDNKSEDNRYAFVGAVAIQYQPGMTITYGADDTAWGSHWACTQTQVVSSLNERVIIYNHIKDGVGHVTPDTPGDGYKKEDLQKTVKTTVTYKDDKGNVLAQPVTNTHTFTGEGYYDKVTGKLVNLNEDGSIKDQNGQITWSAEKTFDAIPAKDIPGYTFDQVDIQSADSKLDVNKNTGAIGGQTMTPTTADSVIDVIYSKDIKAVVHYIDEDENNTVILSSAELTGKEGKQIGYSSANDLKTLTDKGYVLDVNGYDPDGKAPNFDSKVPVYEIKLKHGRVTVTPENPGKPGNPINPNYPNGPKWPDDTDANSLTKTGTQTIRYVGAGDKTPADNTQTYTFTNSMVIDKVTGKVLDPGSWNIDSHTFGTVKTPVIPGYHADKAVAGGATVTPDDLNKVITVTYAPDGNPGNPSDHGDTPTPEPTPEPEPTPTPNPTPDDQPDSEISSHEHFENVKAKGKLDKTNPKKVAAHKKERKIIKTKIAKQGHTEIAEPIEDKVTRENNVKVVSDPVENKAAEPKLPQTGEANNSIIGLLGMLLASIAAMFGFDSLHSHDKKHKN